MDSMNKTEVAVCGLDCARCADYEIGEIKKLSTRLVELLSGYDRVADLKSVKNPLFTEYPTFIKFLQHFSQAACGGCRSDNLRCPIKCHAKNCYHEQGVDFCYECTKYPCGEQFEGKTRERWLERNNRIKEIGLEEYWQEQSKAPRY